MNTNPAVPHHAATSPEEPISAAHPFLMEALVKPREGWDDFPERCRALRDPQVDWLLKESWRRWCEQHLPNLPTADLGPGIHYPQENNPRGIGRETAHRLQNSSAPSHP